MYHYSTISKDSFLPTVFSRVYKQFKQLQDTETKSYFPYFLHNLQVRKNSGMLHENSQEALVSVPPYRSSSPLLSSFLLLRVFFSLTSHQGPFSTTNDPSCQVDSCPQLSPSRQAPQRVSVTFMNVPPLCLHPLSEKLHLPEPVPSRHPPTPKPHAHPLHLLQNLPASQVGGRYFLSFLARIVWPAARHPNLAPQITDPSDPPSPRPTSLVPAPPPAQGAKSSGLSLQALAGLRGFWEMQ